MDEEWPREKYHLPPRDYVHALGAISLNFNIFESALFALFRHHLVSRGLSKDQARRIYSQLNGDGRLEAILALFDGFEPDPMVKDHVRHNVAFFKWCRVERGALMHSSPGSLSLSDDEQDPIHLTKATKDMAEIHVEKVSLDRLRYVADSIRRGLDHLRAIYAHVAVRDKTDAILVETHSSAPHIGAMPPIPEHGKRGPM